MPVLEDVLHELSNSKVFTKVDLSNGYWHVKLSPESSRLTTMQTCFGRYAWLRLPFGLSVSAEIFQRRLLEALSGLTGVVCCADDVIIHGKTTEEHDQNLNSFMKRCIDQGIKLNKNKVQTKMTAITFLGHVISEKGLQTDPEKMKAIVQMPAPTDIKELRQYLGLVNYLSKFIPNMSEVLHPPLNLTKKNTLWTWSKSQQAAFDKIKLLVKNAPTLGFYNPSKELTVESDASEFGLASVLLPRCPNSLCQPVTH